MWIDRRRASADLIRLSAAQQPFFFCCSASKLTCAEAEPLCHRLLLLVLSLVVVAVAVAVVVVVVVVVVVQKCQQQ